MTNNQAMPDDLHTASERIDWFCAWFEVDRPVVTYDDEEPDAILMTEELIEWVEREGVSLDWLVCGSATSLIGAFRERHKEQAQFSKDLHKLTKEQTTGLRVALEAAAAGAPFDDAFSAFQKVFPVKAA